ncbi:MAG: hypothetical protein LUQ09_02565 [Methanomassiliicoccales archaeon]|nr:hypothetical protein [Methanomassiliicoccales archaeon]
MSDRSSITLTSLTASYLIMATAAAIMVAWLSDDWTLFIPSIMMLGGMFATFIGLSQRSKGMNREINADSRYLMFWGTLLIAFAIIWAVNYAYPGNGVLLVVAFLVWMAIAVVLFTLRKRV